MATTRQIVSLGIDWPEDFGESARWREVHQDAYYDLLLSHDEFQRYVEALADEVDAPHLDDAAVLYRDVLVGLHRKAKAHGIEYVIAEIDEVLASVTYHYGIPADSRVACFSSWCETEAREIADDTMQRIDDEAADTPDMPERV